jgi:hypothetical protein
MKRKYIVIDSGGIDFLTLEGNKGTYDYEGAKTQIEDTGNGLVLECTINSSKKVTRRFLDYSDLCVIKHLLDLNFISNLSDEKIYELKDVT